MVKGLELKGTKMEWLKGKKTILGSIAGGVVIVLVGLNVIDDETATVLLGVIATWTGISLRMAVKNGKG